MMKYKKIIFMLVFMIAFITIDVVVMAQTITTDSESIIVDLYGNDISISGKLKAVNNDVTIIVYRNGDNAKSYIDQGKTNENGEYSFQFGLPNGTYKAVVSCGSLKYITSDIVVYKELTGGEEEEINVVVNGDSVNIKGKINEKNKDISIIVYRNSDNAKSYVDQGTTNENGEFSFNFSLPNGIYKAFVNCGSLKYTTSDIVINKKADGGGSSSKKRPKDIIPDNSLMFTDITGHWAEEKIKELVTLGAIGGYPDGTFKPDNNITRAEFTTILVKAFDLKATSINEFDDVKNHWAREFINAGLDNGIMQGYSDSLFGPDELITREQMAIMVVNAMKLNLVECEITFNDTDQISEWAKKYVSIAVSEKLMVGYPDNTFRPKSSATRAEAVTVLLNALNQAK